MQRERERENVYSRWVSYNLNYISCEVVVVGKGDGVDEGGEEHVDGVFVGKTRRELGLGADLHENDRGS